MIYKIKPSKRTAFFFGDSFTQGYPLCWDWTKKTDIDDPIDFTIFDEGNTFCCWPWKADYNDDIFAKKVASWLDYNYVNRASGGIGNDMIVGQVVAELARMRTGDLVVIGLSDWTRLALPRVKHQMMSNILLPDNYTLKEKNLILDYRQNILGPRDEEMKHFWVGMFNNLRDYLTTIKGIEVFLWDAGNFRRFETIREWTKGEFMDYHWSPKGHNQFFEYFKEKYSENKNFTEFSEKYWYYET
jgi:hypothetical protein